VCAIDLAFKTWCWGLGNGGLGSRLPGTPEFECASADVIFACSFSPVAVSTAVRFREVSASYDATCAIGIFGDAFCWGSNRFGQVGTGQKTDDDILTPVPVATDERLRTVFSSSTASCGITPGGSALCWGSGSATPQTVPEPPG
jgi:alpha-tubulin suppressor-like RCC1 family protein